MQQEAVFILSILSCVHSFLQNNTNFSRIDVKFGVILMRNSVLPFDYRRVGPALDIGVEHAKQYNMHIELVPKLVDGNCPVEEPIGHVVELHQQDNVHAIIGPACSNALSGAARLAAYYKLPITTGLGDLVFRDVSNNDVYPTLGIMSFSATSLAGVFVAILENFKWVHVTILYDHRDVLCNYAGLHLTEDFRSPKDQLEKSLGVKIKKQFETLALTFDGREFTDKDIDLLLEEAKAKSRVILLFCSADDYRRIAFRMYKNEMADGDFVVIAVELLEYPMHGIYRKYIKNDHMDAGIEQMYRTTLVLRLSRQMFAPDSVYAAAIDKIKKNSSTYYGYTYDDDEEVNYYIVAFLEAVMYLVYSFRKVVDQLNGTIDDGEKIANITWGAGAFEGYGTTIAIDKHGDRASDFQLLHIPSNNKPKAFAYYLGHKKQLFTPGKVAWPNGLPPDEPPCGFDGDQCLSTGVIVGGVLLFCMMASTLGFAGFVYYRKVQAESEIDKKTWLVEAHELQNRKSRFMDSFLSKSILSMSDTGTSKVQLPGEIPVCKTGHCRQQVVAIRNLLSEEIELTRELCVEFRKMQLANHGNIATFVGAIIEPGHNRILMEFCTRGSLHDMLHNDSVELDWDFRFSLISDICQGMEYLHCSPVNVHGRLTSSNCVIDSRFSLKLTDYGIHSLMDKETVLQQEEFAEYGLNWKRMLYVAPEILRVSEYGAGHSQQADVWGFGIVLQEIIVRGEPFESFLISSEEIVKQLITKKPGLIRPHVPEGSCIPELSLIMSSCLEEDPSERPSFGDIGANYRKLRKGKNTNIMDNLLTRMSDYADNLEQLAADRTKAYLESKKQVEELLSRLLPHQVAKQLQMGKELMHSEHFDCASIFFSDIAEFSHLVSKSSPQEVVTLVNDMYTMFDAIIEQFKVYKVETVRDSYMVVSGIPIGIGDRHVSEISNMSLVLLHAVKSFKIPHMSSSEDLKIRIGLHCGPVVAGVVGQSMPRYCIFGESVNIASQMETNSEAMRILISKDVNDLLNKFSGYNIEKRGTIEIKGKGRMETYWLNEMKDTTGIIFPDYKHGNPSTSCANDNAGTHMDESDITSLGGQDQLDADLQEPIQGEHNSTSST